MSWLEDYLAGLTPEQRTKFKAVAAKAPDPAKSPALVARIALRFQTTRRKKSA